MAENKNEGYFYDDPEKQANTEHQKCPNCGGNMAFDPKKQALVCPFCETSIDFKSDLEVEEKDIETAFALAEKWEDTCVVTCDNCGAKFVMSNEDVAVKCPYCDTSHVRKSAELSGVKPNAIYPFLYTAKEAEINSKKWAKRRIFAPRKFKKNIEADNIHGVYQPFFTFDSDTYSIYQGRLGETKTKTVRTKDGTTTKTYIEWRYVRGTYSHFFNDITISAGQDVSQKVYNKISPFDINTIKVYQKEYLAGFTAKHYEKDLKTCWEESKQVMDNQIRQLILSYEGCDVVDYLNVSTTHHSPTFKYVLMPVYLLNYRYNKKDYRVAINGNTGKVAGKTPISPLRVIIAVLLGLGVLVGGFFLLKHAGVIDLSFFESIFGLNSKLII